MGIPRLGLYGFGVRHQEKVMGITAYIWAAIILLGLAFAARLFKNINGPKTEAAKTERWKAWFDFRKWRRSGRPATPAAPVDPTKPAPAPAETKPKREGFFQRFRRRKKP